VKQHSLCCTELSHADEPDWQLSEQQSDPALTLNLLRQNNEAEIRCGSAKLNERRSFYFSRGLSFYTDTLARNSPTAPRNQEPLIFMSPTSMGIAPVQQIFGLSLEAAPFSLSIESN